jgi:hypothetical protein
MFILMNYPDYYLLNLKPFGIVDLAASTVSNAVSHS